MSFRDNIAFVEQRDGKAAALDYAKRCRNSYRASVLHCTRGNQFRAGWIRNYLTAKQYIRSVKNAS